MHPKNGVLIIITFVPELVGTIIPKRVELPSNSWICTLQFNISVLLGSVPNTPGTSTPPGASLTHTPNPNLKVTDRFQNCYIHPQGATEIPFLYSVETLQSVGVENVIKQVYCHSWHTR